MELKDWISVIAVSISAFIGSWSKFGVEIAKRKIATRDIARQFSIAPYYEKRIVVKILKGQIAFDPELIAIASLQKR